MQRNVLVMNLYEGNLLKREVKSLTRGTEMAHPRNPQGTKLLRRGLDILGSFQGDISAFLNQLPAAHGKDGSDMAAHHHGAPPLAVHAAARVSQAFHMLHDDLDEMLRELAAMVSSAARRNHSMVVFSAADHSHHIQGLPESASGSHPHSSVPLRARLVGEHAASATPPVPAAAWMLPSHSFLSASHSASAREDEDEIIAALEELHLLGVDVVSPMALTFESLGLPIPMSCSLCDPLVP